MTPTIDIRCTDNLWPNGLPSLPDSSVDLTVTSPPYDNLRKYGGHTWDFEGVAQQLWRVTRPGGVVVWVVGDATVNGSETGTSFRQALRFMELGFNLHDTMIYHKQNPLPRQSNRYEQAFEYMFVCAKGVPKTAQPLRVPCKWAGTLISVKTRARDHGGDSLVNANRKPTGDTKIAANVWGFHIGKHHNTHDISAFQHPATFPEKLAEDHILSWSNPGDLVCDPFLGSGTTAKAALKLGRNFIGFEVNPEYVKIAESRLQQ